MDELAYFKAKEYRAIILYLGPVIFHGILPKKQYEHFLYLHAAYRILNDENAIKHKENIDYARKLLRSFVADFPNVYKPELCSYGVHALLHIADDVEYFGKTAIALSAYAFEARLGFISSLVKTGNLPAEQVARRIYERNYFKVDRDARSNQKKQLGFDGKKYYRTAEYTFYKGMANRYCEIDNQLFVIRNFLSVNNETFVFGIPVEDTRAVYSLPSSSICFGSI